MWFIECEEYCALPSYLPSNVIASVNRCTSSAVVNFVLETSCLVLDAENERRMWTVGFCPLQDCKLPSSTQLSLSPPQPDSHTPSPDASFNPPMSLSNVELSRWKPL